MRENEHFPGHGVHWGLASVSVMHSPVVQTPLPSIPLLCHCLQGLPAATLAPCIRLIHRSSHRGWEHNIWAHGQLHTARRSRGRWTSSVNTDGQVAPANRLALVHLPLCSHATLPRTLPWRELTQSALALFKCAGLTAVMAPHAGGAFQQMLMCLLQKCALFPKADILHFFKVSSFLCSNWLLLHSMSPFVEANLARRTLYFHFANFQVGFIYLNVTCKNVKWQVFIPPLLLFIILLYEQSRVSLPRCLLEHQTWFYAAFGYLTEINVIYILIPAYQQIK